jgi:hypothetical protein
MRFKGTVLSVVFFALLALSSASVSAQNYDAVLKSLAELRLTIQALKADFSRHDQTGQQYADVDATQNPANASGDPFVDFAVTLESTVAALETMVQEEKKADAARPKNPPEIARGKIAIGAYTHQQYYSQGGDDKESSFISKRARLSVAGSLNEFSKIKIMGEFAGSPKLLDAIFTLSPNKYWSLNFGQYKPPFGTDFLIAASAWPFVNTSMAKGLGTDRDVGATIDYKNKLSPAVAMKLSTGVFNGAGINTTDKNTDKNFVARGEFTFSKAVTFAPNFYVGKSNDTGVAIQNIHSYGGSITYALGQNTLSGEYIYSKVDDTKQAGWYIWGGHMFKTNARILPEVQLLARFEQLDENLDADNDMTSRITIGTNLFVDKKYTKLQLNYQINGEQGTSVSNNEFLANFQVAF